jgi:hypothetical protein
MGANAQIAVPAFTAGQVLTATQQTQINTGIPVFATTVTRDAAFGGTGEKVLAEGQFAYIEATNTTQYYDGAAWVSVGVSGLNFITGNPFTGVTSVQVNDCFTSTYRNYRIYIDCVGNTAGNTLSLRLSASGTPATVNYFSGTQTWDYTAVTGFSSRTASDRVLLMYLGSNGSAADAVGMSLDIIRPQLVTSTDFLSLNNGINAGTAYAGGISIAKHTAATAYDGFTLINSAGTNIAGTYRVYGLADS